MYADCTLGVIHKEQKQEVCTMQSNQISEETRKKGGIPGIVQSFQVTGLYGYRNISLNSPYAATILIARNGSGKTTFLGVMDAFLKREFSRLRDVDFREIRCKIIGVEEELTLTKENLLALFDLPTDGEISRAARRYEVDPLKLVRFLEAFPRLRNDRYALRDDPVFSAVEKKVGFRLNDVTNVFDKLLEGYFEHNDTCKYIDQILNVALNGVEILYLPTYRRVELSLNQEDDEPVYGRRRRRPRFLMAGSGLFTGDIQFGLSDISDRLAELNTEIFVNSNTGYRRLSAAIINDMIDGVLEKANFEPGDLPDKEDLNLFFSRLKEGSKRLPFEEVTPPKLDRLYAGEPVETGSGKFLSYFLSKLNSVIKTTKDIELPIEEFIVNCNKYLSAKDSIANAPSADNHDPDLNADDKVLRLDRRTLSVYAESVATERKIALDALSSGEKQMISLFAKLFLYPGEKIILIDEPELSLSLDWQKEILPDVLRAPLCRQIIAITHSPFIFDNALEPYARSLQLRLDPRQLVSLNDQNEGDLSE
jgi:ABC-type lipoprotein export system ATPase subunit